MTPNKTRQILAAQKLRLEATPQKIDKLPPLTAEQRRQLYAPKPANTAPEYLQGSEWIKAWRTVEKTTYGLTAILATICGGLVMGESKKSVRQ
jgi:hypothetical protein